MPFDPNSVKYDNNPNLRPGTRAEDCPCSFCEETRRAFDRAAQQFQAEADKTKKDKKKK